MPGDNGNTPPAPAVEEAPPAPPNNGVAVVPLGFTIQIPDLRNGDAAMIQQAAPKASVAVDYKWPVITGLPADKNVEAVEFLIRACYAQLCTAGPKDATDAQRAEFRRRAIVLGAVRAGAASAYLLGKADMNSMECVVSGLEYNSGRILTAGGVGTANGRAALVAGMEGLSNQEVAVVGVLVYLGMAVPVLQGASLVVSGHHFLPNTKNIFMGMKRQALGLGTESTRQWIESLGETFEDLAFHKACHPISPPAKRRWAKDPMIAMRLKQSGHGAAAVRLPALPSDAAVGKSAIALVSAAKPVIVSMGHTCDMAVGPKLIRALEQANEGADEREAIANIQNWASAHQATLAFCAGIKQHLHESAGVGRDTLLSAYSVRKIMAEHPTQVQTGIAYSRAAASKIRADLEKGVFPDPNLKM